ncbi:MAG: plastocyanin/azurin family copper-binding protein [Solirubrobacterales bacterium]|nr:plastocyanin/azurin family copper-binding protein [Solirubrobacterales bacterium]
MMISRPSNPVRRRSAAAATAVAITALLAALTGCGGVSGEGNSLVAGKEAFIAKCGSCHTLNRAGTKGLTGPNLDEAFQQALKDGFGRDTVQGIVYQQILFPNRNGVMQAKIAEGDLALEIAHYVADVAAKPGKDVGALGDVGRVTQKPLATAKDGVLVMPADPGGQLLYTFKNAVSTAGPLVINTPNKSQTPHNIAIDGPGANAAGKVVVGGGTSTISVTVAAGKYAFFCTVPGHRQAGMEGVLTVK